MRAADRKCQHACYPHYCDGQRHTCKHAEHHGVQAIRREHFGADIFKRGRVLNGLIGGHRANQARDWRDQRVRISGCVDEQATAKDHTSLKGVVDSDCGLRNEVIIVNIGRDTDDAVRRHQACLVGISSREELQYGIRPKDMPIDGILIGEHALCERLADDNDRVVIVLAVERVEIAAGDDGNTKRCKVSGRDSARRRAGILFAAGVNVTISRKLQTSGAGAIVAPGNDVAECGPDSRPAAHQCGASLPCRNQRPAVVSFHRT